MHRQSLKRIYWMVLLMLFAVLLMNGTVFGASKQVLEAAKVKAAPAGLEDAIWNEATAIQVPFEGKESFPGQKAVLPTKAV